MTPSFFLCACVGGGGCVLHQLHRIVPPGHGLLVLEGDLSRLLSLRAAAFQVSVSDVGDVGVALGAACRGGGHRRSFGLLVFLFDLSNLTQGPVERSLKENMCLNGKKKGIFKQLNNLSGHAFYNRKVLWEKN